VCILLVFLTYVYRDARFKECKVCTKEPNIFWCPVRNVPRLTFLTPRILRWLLDFGFLHPQPTLLLILVQCKDIFLLFYRPLCLQSSTHTTAAQNLFARGFLFASKNNHGFSHFCSRKYGVRMIGIQNFKNYISELTLDSYEYIPASFVVINCIILP
jgi:hypothetical protein